MWDEGLLDLVVCPLCRQKFVHEKEDSCLKCPQCGRKFPIVDGIVDAFVPIEGLKSFNIDFPERYEHWGEFVTRGESNKQRKQITTDLVEGDLLLEVGCAEGYMTGELARKASRVIASDIALSYLKRAKARVPNANFARLDAHNIPFADDAFDCVVCAEVLEHTLCPLKALEEMHRVLKLGGYLVISVPNGMTRRRVLAHVFRRRDSLVGVGSAHINFYDAGSLLQILEVTGFATQVVTGDYTPRPFVGRFARRYLAYLGGRVIVKAAKKKADYWERLDQRLERHKSDKNGVA